MADRALTLRQPWAWLIIFGPKRIENRRWRTYFRGRFFIHTSKLHARKDHELAARVAAEYGVDLPPRGSSAYQCGGIIGSVEVVDVLDRWSSAAPWKFEGQYGFVLEDVRAHKFVPCKGALNFWPVPDEVLQQVV